MTDATTPVAQDPLHCLRTAFPEQYEAEWEHGQFGLRVLMSAPVGGVYVHDDILGSYRVSVIQPGELDAETSGHTLRAALIIAFRAAGVCEMDDDRKRKVDLQLSYVEEAWKLTPREALMQLIEERPGLHCPKGRKGKGKGKGKPEETLRWTYVRWDPTTEGTEGLHALAYLIRQMREWRVFLVYTSRGPRFRMYYVGFGGKLTRDDVQSFVAKAHKFGWPFLSGMGGSS